MDGFTESIFNNSTVGVPDGSKPFTVKTLREALERCKRVMAEEEEMLIFTRLVPLSKGFKIRD